MKTGDAIATVCGREIFDSRGEPTLAVTVELKDGTRATAAVPSGKSVGLGEARELRDGGSRRFVGRGVRQALANVRGPLYRAVRGVSATAQAEVDRRLNAADGTPDKSRLGANAIVGVSLAVTRAAAGFRRQSLYRYLRQTFFSATRGWRLPTPMCNVLNGGLHAGGNLDVQEFLLLPRQRAVAEQLRCVAEISGKLRQLLRQRRLTALVGDEGGVAPRLATNEAAFQLLASAVRQAGYQLSRDVRLGVDVAASELYTRGKYRLQHPRAVLTPAGMVLRLRSWARRFSLATIEDGLAETDWAGWRALTQAVGDSVRLVGDDVFVTNRRRLLRGINERVANAIVIKPNQVGTLSETVAAMRLARQHRYALVVSHRSGETNDDFIVDLAVAANAEYLKAGAVCRGERVAKWNRLLEIADEIAAAA